MAVEKVSFDFKKHMQITPSTPSDNKTTEPPKEETPEVKEKSNAAKYMIGAAALATIVIGGIIGHKNNWWRKAAQKGDELINEGERKAGEGIDNITESATQKLDEAADEATQKLEDIITEPQPKAGVVEDSSATAVDEAAAAAEKEAKRIAELKASYSETLKHYGIDAEVDDDVLAIIEKHLTAENVHDFAISLIMNKTYISQDLMGMAKKVQEPLRKEELLQKAFKYLPFGNPAAMELEGQKSMEDIYKNLRALYNAGDDFKSKEFFENTIQPKFMEIFENKKSIKILNELLGSKCDYDLYEKLYNKAGISPDNHPLSDFNLEWSKADDKTRYEICKYISNTLQDIIRKEKDVVKREDLLLKQWNVTSPVLVQSRYDTLMNINSLYLADPNAKFVHKDKVLEEINKVVDKWFGGYDMPLLTSQQKKFATSFLSYKHFISENERVSQVLEALSNAAYITSNENVYRTAVNFARQQNSIDNAINIIEGIKYNEKLSQSFVDEMTKLQTKLKIELNTAKNSILSKLKNPKPLNESFESLTSNECIKKAAADIGSTLNMSSADILKKMQEGDGETILNVIKTSITQNKTTIDFVSDIFKGEKREKLPAQFFDDLIQYLSRADEVVKNPKDLELLRNIKLFALAQKVRILKPLQPEQSKTYNDVLRTEVVEMLFGKGSIKDIGEKFDEEMISSINNRLSDIIFDPEPEYSLFNAIKFNLDYKNFNDDTVKIFKGKADEIKTRLGIKTDEDYFEEFKRRFYSGESAKTSSSAKQEAYEVFNEYLEDGEKLTQTSSAAEIKAAYRKLAQKYHPDKIRNPEEAKKCEDIFKRISSAYGTIK